MERDLLARRAGLEQVTSILSGSLSAGRRHRAILDSGASRAFQTDLHSVTVPYPVPGGRSLRWISVALALQSSPTKEALTTIPWPAFRTRQRRALAWVEGEMAARWAARAWPGLAADLRAELPWVDFDGEVVADGAELAALAADRASAYEEEPPLTFGRLPPPRVPTGGSLQRTFIATRWSTRHKAKRAGALPIPVSGPGGEPVVHPGEPGSMEALEGKPGHALGIPYDEWDCWRARYRRDYVRVLEYDGPATEGPRGTVLPLPRLHAARSRRRGFEHGDVDIDAVVQWRCDLAARVSEDPLLFTQLAVVGEPVAWCLLVDASASSSLAGGRVMRAGLRHANTMAATLSAQGEKVGVLAFRSKARERIEVRTLKHFDRPYKPISRDMKPAGYTRLGGALRHAGRRLRAVSGRAHVLVYLGDAVPYDEGYGERYGQADVAKAVEELTAHGTHVHHASLAGHDADVLDEMFGRERWRRISSEADLVRLVSRVQDELNEEM